MFLLGIVWIVSESATHRRSEPANALRLLLRRRHWQPHRVFTAEYDKAAARVDRRLVGTGPSRVQLHRWQAGQISGLPYPDHCRVLEAMFPGWAAAELFQEAVPEVLAARELNGVSAAGRETVDDGPSAEVTAYATRGEFMSALPPQTLFDSARQIRAAGLSLNLLCQHYPDQSLHRLVANGCVLRCLFLDPEGEAIRCREREEGHPEGRLAVLTELNIHLLQRLRDKLRDEHRDRLSVAVYDEPIRHNIVIVNDDLCVVQPYLTDARGLDSPTYVIRRRGRERGLFPAYESEFAALWKRGREL